MDKRMFTASIAALAAGVAAVAAVPASAGPTARFDYVEYRALGEAAPTPAGQYRNQIGRASCRERE